MNHYAPPTDAMRFVLLQVLNAPQALHGLPAFVEVDADVMAQVVEAAGQFVGEVIAPLNRVGDEVGAQWQAGAVTMPPGFRDAYQAFWQAGWPSLSVSTDEGGQGLPVVLDALLYEMLSAANHGWTMAPGLLHGAHECLRHHGSEALKARYLSKIASGEWLATMCLTEPQAGSDLGQVTTRALPQADGRYALTGTKIFISGGEHDLTDNIVHLVLARLPDAPPGPKGLSLFVVPKFEADGTRSAVTCERIEEKMGLHGSPTCVMRFDGAVADIVGEPGKGLAAMFVMMNAARLHVALQGIGLLSAAWQKADAYARERRQMRAPGSRTPAGQADAIIDHPAMRRILDTQRAWIDGGRVLAYRTALELDVAAHAADTHQRASSERWCALVTPVLKAAFTHQAFHGGSDCLQVFGGHGYVREWGIEQHVRDARVTMIYEGTNEIQAIDLLQRKVLAGDGVVNVARVVRGLQTDLRHPHASDAAFDALGQWLTVSEQLAERSAHDAVLAFDVAEDYLRVATLALLAWAWDRIAAALPHSTGVDAAPYRDAFNALHRWVLPELPMRLAIIDNRLGAASAASV